ncbi:AAA domain-containing protein [Cyanobacterium aponinum UTEX 3221]|uniref:DEAD/DEAH box helicase n=1 Tax=Cyanobacterium aponinum TaxID=379064 RepID=UPI002B4BFAC5|nr:AAA domain-containing protein [Cyanobacterium aponinum]WRL37129.1 AAA domain-containing protein [Cyanobacterium aponinum UTEX 3221]
MKVSEVQAGRKLSLEIKQVHDNLFLPEKSFNIEQEISILQSQLTGEIFITNQQDSWVIEGVNQDNQNKLLDLIDRSLPRLCWVMALQPNLQTPDTIFLQVHEFPNKLYLPNEKIEIGIDERIVDDIRDRHLRKSEPIDKIIEWLNKKILLPHPKNNQLKRALLQAGNKIKNSLESSFQLWGNGIVINIKKTADNKFLINRVERARQPKDINEQRPMIILEADIYFCDASIAGSLRGNIQTELDDIVKKSDSYLALWQEYNNIERKIIWDNAREFGWLKYVKQIALKNGNYRFKLENTVNRKKELKAKFKLLRENPTLSLEVNKKPPNFSHDKDDNNEQDSGLLKREFSQDGKSFLGEVVEIDSQKLEIEIKPSNADDEEITSPHQGYIFISLLGDRIRLQRRTLAESAIRMAQNPMPQLALLLENRAVSFRRTRNIKPITKEVKKLFNGLSPTPRQEEAINIALNTPDIALIQGPPGTGKTKVITAIEARLAEEAEDANRSVNHRILLTSYQHDAVENAAERTTLFQLPAVRIGGKKGKNSELDNVDRWRRERIQRVRASLAHLPKLTGQETLRKVKQLTAMYQLTPGNQEDTVKLLKDIYELTICCISPDLSDQLLRLSQELKQNRSHLNQEDSEKRELALKAVQGIRVTWATFSDDGDENALKALARLKPLDILSKEEEDLLKQAGVWVEESEPPFLGELVDLQQKLLERLIPKETQPVTTPVANPKILDLFKQVRLSLDDYVKQSPDGIEGVLTEYLNDLETDPEEVARTIRKYTVVLAATCQQSVGKKMIEATENKDHVFESVIIDEAARANPLDLFIPMAKAERRIILVGDHRQLPHILEDDVEKELTKSTFDTQDALKKSLFERLFNQLQELERKDGIKRTVTLDTQYRMHPILGDFVSENFYECHGESHINSGRCANDFIHNLPGYENSVTAWLNVPFSAGGEIQGQSKSRPVEARAIAFELKRLIEHDQKLTFGIIAFYSAQVTEIWKALEEVGIAEKSEEGFFQVAKQWQETTNYENKIVERLRVGTVDAFQGKEFDVVFLSLTRSNNINPTDERMYRRKYGFLMLENRLCVAMSRQQRLLIAVGDGDMVNHKSARVAIPQLVNFYQLCQSQPGKIYQCYEKP